MYPLFIFSSDTFEINRERAIDYLNTRDNVYVFDGYAGVSPWLINDLHLLLNSHSGIQSTESKSASSVPGHTMPCSW